MFEQVIQQIKDGDMLSRTRQNREHRWYVNRSVGWSRGDRRYLPYLLCGVKQSGVG